jgi:hypothetical protein
VKMTRVDLSEFYCKTRSGHRPLATLGVVTERSALSDFESESSRD